MRTTCWTIEPNGKIAPTDEESALARWRQDEGPVWIDVEVTGQDEIVAWLVDLGVEEDVLTVLKATDFTGRILPGDTAIFFEYPVPGPDAGEAPVLFACICLSGLAITMHTQPVSPEYLEVTSRLLRLPEPNTSGLVCAMVMLQSSRLRREALRLRDRSRELTKMMDKDAASVSLEEILDLKSRLMDVDRMVDEQLAVLEILQTLAKPNLNLVNLAEQFNLAVGNVKAADRRLERLDRLVMGLQQRFESLQQDRINRRLGVLTIVSAIFMPLTFIAGVYGMNFDIMPELHFRFGYLMVLVVMALIAGGLYWYFKTRDWLD